MPGAPPAPKATLPPTRPTDFPVGLEAPTGPAVVAPFSNGSKKRTWGEVDMQNAEGTQFGSGRGLKHARRGGRFDGDRSHGGFTPGGPPSAPFLQPPPGMPQFDPNNPLKAMLEMQAMGIPLPPMPDYGPQDPGRPQQRRRQRCRDYDTKGYCARGSACMFEHGNDSIFVPPARPAEGDGKFLLHCGMPYARAVRPRVLAIC